MAENKGPADRGTVKNPQLNKDAKELEREARHQGEGQERRDVVDSETGEAGIQDKGLGGDGADDSSVSERRDAPPVSDNG